jgi:hypothetical protein
MEDTPGGTFIGIGIGGIVITVVFIVLAIIMGIVLGVSIDSTPVTEPNDTTPAELQVEPTAIEETEEAGVAVEEATAEITESVAAGAVVVSITPSPTKETFGN